MSNAAKEKSDDNSSNQAIRSANEEEKSADNIGGNQSTRSANEEEKSDDNTGGDQATQSANEEKSDDISSAEATSKKSGVIAAPKPRAVVGRFCTPLLFARGFGAAITPLFFDVAAALLI